MEITGDPLLPYHDLQARNYLIACFAVSLSRGETLLGSQIQEATISKYVQAVCTLHKDRKMPSPRNADTDYIEIVLKALRKYEKKKDRREMIHDDMYRHMEAKRASLHQDSLEAALFDWFYLGRYTGYRSVEWCQTKVKEFLKITHPNWEGESSYAFINEDIEVYRANGQQVFDYANVTADEVDHFYLRYRKQKNDRNYEVIPYKKDDDNPAFCPVRAILRILKRAIRLKVPQGEPIAVFGCSKGRYKGERCFITNSHVEQSLRATARAVYKFKKDDPRLKRWSSHSIRVTACNLLHRQGLSDTYIQTRLRWRSNAFLDYLRNTLYAADTHKEALRINTKNLPNLTTSWEVITLPSGTQAQRNSPVGRVIQRRRGREELEQVLCACAA